MQIALDNFLKIYEADRAGKDIVAVVQEELFKFRTTVSDQLMGDLNANVDELVAMREEKQKELEKIRNTQDPVKVNEIFVSSLKMHNVITLF